MINEKFRQKPPAALETIPFNIPKPFVTELSNGLKIVIVEDRRYPVINFRLAFHLGNINDPDGAIGLVSAASAMLTEGTEKHNSKELAEEIESRGLFISGKTGTDNTIISASTLVSYKAALINLLAEVVLTPTFPEDELKLYKQNTIEGLKFQRSQPDFLADEQVARIIYGPHPYSVHSPTADDIEKLTREQLVKIHKLNFMPNNAMLIAVGDIESNTLVRDIEAGFGNWECGTVPKVNFPKLPVRTEKTLTIVDRPGSSQSNIVLANLAVNRSHPDYFNLVVMNQILGAGASSRLFMNLREDKGYTYGAYSHSYFKRHAGSFESTSEVRTAVTGDSLREFFFELNRIRDEQASNEELKDAKNFLTGVFPIKAETQSGLTSLIVSQRLYDLPEDYLETYRENINAVTLEDVQRVANKYVLPNETAMIIVGDAEEIVSQVKQYTENIEIFDTAGKQQNIDEYAPDSNVKTTNISGNWELIVEAMGQKLSISLNLVQNGEKIFGKLESPMVEGSVEEGKVNGNKLSAIAKTEFQGRKVELKIKGTVDSESIKGTMSMAGIIPINLEFSGIRK